MDESPWEDHLLERKTENDLKDLRKTLVAFANSVRPGHVARILIGELDDGTVQGVRNPDSIQKKVRAEAGEVYPSMVWRQQLYERDGTTCVRVEIEYSGETPHFGSAAWLRKGSQTVTATDEMFQKLIEFRNSKLRMMAESVHKKVVFERPSHIRGQVTGMYKSQETLAGVNAFYATFELVDGTRRSEPLETLSISWDHNYDCLKLAHRPIFL